MSANIEKLALKMKALIESKKRQKVEGDFEQNNSVSGILAQEIKERAEEIEKEKENQFQFREVKSSSESSSEEKIQESEPDFESSITAKMERMAVYRDSDQQKNEDSEIEVSSLNKSRQTKNKKSLLEDESDEQQQQESSSDEDNSDESGLDKKREMSEREESKYYYEDQEEEEELKSCQKFTKELKESSQNIEEVRERWIQYSQYFQEYKKRRVFKFQDGKIDLGVLYVQELLYHCYKQELISRNLMLSIKHLGLPSSIDYLKKYKADNLEDFNFESVKFTLFDHRRLTRMLINKDPNKYALCGKVFALPYQVHEFIEEIYKMEESQYNQRCSQMDEKHKLLWWASIGSEYKGEKYLKDEENNFVQQEEPVIQLQQKARRSRALNPIQARKRGLRKQGSDEDEKQRKRAKQNPQVGIIDQQELSKIEEDDSKSVEKPASSFKSGGLSSSLFDSEGVFDSLSVSLNSESHSISNISDIFSDSISDTPETRKKKRKFSTKQSQSQKSAIRVQNLQKAQSQLKKRPFHSTKSSKKSNSQKELNTSKVKKGKKQRKEEKRCKKRQNKQEQANSNQSL